MFVRFPSSVKIRGPPAASVVRGVGQVAIHAASANAVWTPPSFNRCGFLLFFVVLLAVGVGHPIQPLSDVRRADARSAQIGSRCGISHVFQVSEHSGEPFTSSATCNLFAKDR